VRRAAATQVAVIQAQQPARHSNVTDVQLPRLGQSARPVVVPCLGQPAGACPSREPGARAIGEIVAGEPGVIYAG